MRTSESKSLSKEAPRICGLLLIAFTLGIWPVPAIAEGETPAEPPAENEPFTSVLIPGPEEEQSVSQKLVVALERKLWEAHWEQVEAPFRKGLSKLNAQYSSAVTKLGQSDKSPAVQIAVDAELQALESGAGLIGEDGKVKPSPVPELRKLQATYQSVHDQLVVSRSKTTRSLLVGFARELTELKTQLDLGQAEEEAALVEKLASHVVNDDGTREMASILTDPRELAVEKLALNPSPAEEMAHPVNKQQMEDFLLNSVWTLQDESGNRHGWRFHGDGHMSMHWHPFRWEATGKQSADIFTNDWRFNLEFTDDFKQFHVKNRNWSGTFSNRIRSLVSEEDLEKLVTSSKWSLTTEEGESLFVFEPKGSVAMESGPVKSSWRRWKIDHGVLIISDQDRKTHHFAMLAENQPVQLKGISLNEGKLALVAK